MKKIYNGGLFISIVFIGSLVCGALPAQAASFSLSESDISKFTGEAASDVAGMSVSPAGDVNNDGYDDVIIGAELNSGGGTFAGAAYLIYGQSTPLSDLTLSAATTVKFTGEAALDNAGHVVSSAGDVNNDGYDDILIGAVGNSGGGSSAGAVYLIYGQSAVLSDMTLSAANTVKFNGEAAADIAGISAGAAGDVNNDGYDDFLIGAYGNDAGGASAGAAYLVYGQSSVLSDTTLSAATAVKFTGEVSADLAGISVSSAGDVNNDTYDDILVGAYGNDDGGANAGAAYLIYGQSSALADITLNATNAVKLLGEASGDITGFAVSAAGDLNNDTYDDFVIGAESNDTNGTASGAAFVVYGQSSALSDMTLNTTTASRLAGEEAFNFAGRSVSSAQDVNNDGYDDLIVGAYGNSSSAGAAYLVYGQSAVLADMTLSSATADKFIGETANDYAGWSVSSAGDTNGDGYGELFIGAEQYGAAGSSTGAGYVVYMQVDTDRDGVTGTSGLTNGADCSDADAALIVNQTYYRDADGDGKGSASTTTSACSLTAPAGYVTNTTDSNDTDFDNDGSVTGTDCDDRNAVLQTTTTYYRDLDGDGLGNAASSTTVCAASAPAGYVANQTDTNDSGVVDSNDTNDDVTQDIEIGSDGIDNDGDGTIDEVNTLTSNGAHPTYKTVDPNSATAYATDVVKIAGASNGRVTVTYADNSVFQYTVFAGSTTAKTTLTSVQGKGYVAVVSGDGKKLALLNVYSGEVYSTKKLSATKKYAASGVKIATVRTKPVAIVTSREKGAVRVSLVRIQLSTPTLNAVSSRTMTNKNVAVTKTTTNGAVIILRNSANKKLTQFQVSKNFALQP